MASNIIARLFRSTKKNAKQRGIDFYLKIEELQSMYENSNGRCCMTGIEFDHSPANGKKRPFTASIDRIDSSKPYSIDNCRLVCVAINLAMNWYGEEVFERVAHAYINERKNDPTYAVIKGIPTAKLKDGSFRYYPRLKINSKDVRLGSFKSEREASIALNIAIKERDDAKRSSIIPKVKLPKKIVSPQRIAAVEARELRSKKRKISTI